jgi:MFS family permease
VVGSALCGFAWSSESLIAFRVLQGLGGGMVMPVGMMILAQAAGPQRMGRVLSVIGVPMLIAPVIGPALGGYLIDAISWRWIFFVNIPIGLAAAWVLLRRFEENVTQKTSHQIDYAGATLLAIGGSLLLLGLLEGGVMWSWDSSASIAILAVAASRGAPAREWATHKPAHRMIVPAAMSRRITPQSHQSLFLPMFLKTISLIMERTAAGNGGSRAVRPPIES